jgi:hypothetical protein
VHAWLGRIGFRRNTYGTRWADGETCVRSTVETRSLSHENGELSTQLSESLARLGLVRPRPGFYVTRLRRCARLVPAVIYQLCPMVMPQPSAVNGPNPEEWCRPFGLLATVWRADRRQARRGRLRMYVLPTAGQPGGITPSAGVACAAGPGPTPRTQISITVPEQDRRDE